MGQYTVNHACGHSVVRNLGGPLKDRYRTIEYIEKFDCPACQNAPKKEICNINNLQIEQYWSFEIDQLKTLARAKMQGLKYNLVAYSNISVPHMELLISLMAVNQGHNGKLYDIKKLIGLKFLQAGELAYIAKLLTYGVPYRSPHSINLAKLLIIFEKILAPQKFEQLCGELADKDDAAQFKAAQSIVEQEGIDIQKLKSEIKSIDIYKELGIIYKF